MGALCSETKELFHRPQLSPGSLEHSASQNIYGHNCKDLYEKIFRAVFLEEITLAFTTKHG